MAEAKNISSRIWTQHPEAGEQLDKVLLEPEEQDGFIRMMQSVSDVRLQHLGRDVGLAMHRSLSASANSHEAKLQLLDALEPQLDQLRQLRDEVIPRSIRGAESD